jgi:isopenicillin N synthase-like dioxygenase
MDLVACVDIKSFLAEGASTEALAACAEVARSLRETGIVLLRDPRVSDADSSMFLDTMEDYMAQDDAVKIADERPMLHYQVGTTREGVEVPLPRSSACDATVDAMPMEHRPSPVEGADPKWRFFWRIGPRPGGFQFEDLNAAPVVPDAFPMWASTMDNWGGLMLAAVKTCAEMASLGLGLPRDALPSLMHHGPHLLAPTASDLSKFTRVGQPLAGWHSDLNLLTIHGKSRYPGLYVWLRDGSKVAVSVPTGCLLVQAGQQFEYLTAGYIRAGMHEVVVTDAALEAARQAAINGRPPWRISSTLFAHVSSSSMLAPLSAFAGRIQAADYPPVTAGEQVLAVLKQLKLCTIPMEPSSEDRVSEGLVPLGPGVLPPP